MKKDLEVSMVRVVTALKRGDSKAIKKVEEKAAELDFDEEELLDDEEGLEDEEDLDMDDMEMDEDEFDGDQEEGDEEEGDEEESQYEEVLEEVENAGVDPDEGVMMSLNTKEVIEKADLHLIKVKIAEVLKILEEFSKNREEGKTTYEYVDDLKDLFCNYYGYSSDVMDLFLSLFSPHECQQFLEANQDQRPLTIRCNTLSTKRKDLAQA